MGDRRDRSHSRRRRFGIGAILAALLAASSASPAGGVDPSADVRVALTRAPSVVELETGQTVTYTAVVANDGPDTAADVVFLDPFGYERAPARVESVETTVGACAILSSGQTASCDLGDLASGASAAVTVEALFFGAGVFENTVSVASATPDPDPTNDQASASVVVIPGPPFEERVTTGYFTTLLGRPPTEAELATWSAKLSRIGPTQYVAELLATNSWKLRQIDLMFRRYLGRPADPGAKQAFLAYLNSGKRTLDLVGSIVGSGEYLRKAGGTDEAFYARMYRDLTGDPPVPYVPSATRAAAAMRVMNGEQGRRKYIDQMFRTWFDRPAGQFDLYVGLSELSKSGMTFDRYDVVVLGSYDFYRQFLFFPEGDTAFVPSRAAAWKEAR